MKIGFVTYRELPLITSDDQLVVDELSKLGIEVLPLVWEENNNLEEFKAIIIRSCWNYHLKLQEFIRWLDKVDEKKIKLFNSSNVVKWNLNKKYLLQLANKGVKIPKTILIEKGQRINLASILRENKITEAVIKPTVSLTAYNTWRTSINLATQDQDQFAKQVEKEEIIIQSFLEEITIKGELSFIFLGGEYSYTVCKKPKEGDFRVQSDFGGTKVEICPSDKQLKQVMKIYELLVKVIGQTSLMYARIDVVEVQEEMSLMEVELIDPELYFRFNAGSAKKMAKIIARDC